MEDEFEFTEGFDACWSSYRLYVQFDADHWRLAKC